MLKSYFKHSLTTSSFHCIYLLVLSETVCIMVYIQVYCDGNVLKLEEKCW